MHFYMYTCSGLIVVSCQNYSVAVWIVWSFQIGHPEGSQQTVDLVYILLHVRLLTDKLNFTELDVGLLSELDSNAVFVQV